MTDQRWIEAITSFFYETGNQTRIRDIGRAGGCREGWIQGELFHYFAIRGICLETNAFPISDESGYFKADLHVNGPYGLVAECKVLNKWGTAYKMLDGHGIRGPQSRLNTNGALRYEYDILHHEMEPSVGLLRDFYRLALSKKIKNDITRLLILVLHTDPPNEHYENDPLGELLLQVAFGDPEDEHLVLNENGLMVKIWRVKPQEARIE